MVLAPLQALCIACQHFRLDHTVAGSCDIPGGCSCTRFERGDDVVEAAPLHLPRAQVLGETIRRVVRGGSAFGEAFYDKLFERYPAMERRFANVDREMQHVKLWAALTTIANAGVAPSALVQYLGASHATEGVVAQDYQQFIGVLLETLQEFVGDDLTPEMHNIWSEVLTDVASAMAAHGAGSRSR